MGSNITPKPKGFQVPPVQGKIYHWEEGRAALAATFDPVDEAGGL